MKTKILWIGAAVLTACPIWADSITFNLLPANGSVSGSAGSVVGWGYSLTNNSAADWFLGIALNSDSFSNGTPTSLFDFPDLAPGQTVTEAFDAVNTIGLFELQWAMSAPSGFVNTGNFVLSGQWWNGDPLNGGTLIGDATDVAIPYSATVSGGSGGTMPEPASLWLLASGIALIVAWRSLGLLLGHQDVTGRINRHAQNS
jgi:hypothetical protein